MTPCTTGSSILRGRQPSISTQRPVPDEASRFAGLPEGITRWRLAAALRAAARLLNLNASMLRLIEHYIDCTYDIDWTPGNEPVITRPLTETAAYLGRSERQLRNLEKALAERGLLAWRDSANHHRRGQRDRGTGRLLHAYGPSLAPLARRAHDIIALAAQARAEIAAMRRVRLEIGALRRRLRCAMITMDETDIEHGERDRIDAILKRRLPARLSLEALEHHKEDLEIHLSQWETQEDGHDSCLCRIDENAAEPAILRRPLPNTAIRDRSVEPTSQTRREQAPPGLPKTTERISMDMIRRAAGPTMNALIGDTGCWNSLVSAAEQSVPMIGIAPGVWQEGCQRMGRVETALSLLIIENASLRPTTSRWPPLRNPTAYLRGMIRRHEQGQLNLGHSIRKIARDRQLAKTARHGSW